MISDKQPAIQSQDTLSAYQRVVSDIRRYEQEYERECNSVRLIAVSKTRTADEVNTIVNQGQVAFGENYLQEALEKKAELANGSLEWHFIGSIQSRKAKQLAQNFDWVHSVDRLKVANGLSQSRDPELGPINLLIQVNLQAEPTKSGVLLEDLPILAEQMAVLPNVRLRGLMVIPEPQPDIERQRAVFAKARIALDNLNQRGLGLTELSMGMTDDLPAAIAEGATMVRVGTAIFGARKPKQTNTKNA